MASSRSCSLRPIWRSPRGRGWLCDPPANSNRAPEIRPVAEAVPNPRELDLPYRLTELVRET